jgi:hypothetical protein
MIKIIPLLVAECSDLAAIIAQKKTKRPPPGDLGVE